MNDDAVLLHCYAEEGSETAFAELVRRHIDLVYGAALRRTGGDSHLAADVAQQVFTALARGARRLSRHAVLAAWLHTATRNAALNLMISEQRRQTRETAALTFDAAIVAGEASPDWEQLRPLLDAAIDELPEADRAAVVLRFLEHRPFAEVGSTLHVSEDAARMRTDRALDKLRSALARRGITSTAAALGAIVLGQPLISAPAGLAATLASQGIAAAGAGFFVTSLASFMTIKFITTVALSALIAFGAGAYVGLNYVPSTPSPSSLEVPRQSALIASLRQDNRQLTAEVASLNTDLAKLNEANAALVAKAAVPPPPASTPKSVTLGWMPRYEQQRLIMASLRQVDAARDQFLREKGRAPVSVHELVGIDRYIKTVRPVNSEDYASLSMAGGQPLSVTTADGMTVTFDPSGAGTTRIEMPPEVARAEELSRKVGPAIQKATEAYRLANPTAKSMPNPQALIPYFATPQDGADFIEFMEAQKTAFAAQKAAR